MKDTAVLITTFLRDTHLYRCIKSVRVYYPHIAIYVGDNGRTTKEKLKFCKYHNFQHIEIPFDSVVCGTINKALVEIPRKYIYIAIIEDDIIFNAKSKLETLRTILSGHKELGIAGGLLRLNENKEQHYEAITYIKDRTHFIEKVAKPKWKTYGKIKYFTPDLILNVFLAKHAVFNDCLWDKQFKTAFEHSDFFLRLKQTKWKVAYVPKVEMLHKPEGSSDKYRKYRERTKGWVLFAEKWGVENFKSSYNPNCNETLKLGQCTSWKKNPKDAILSDAIEILNTHKIKWWLEAGTCLGVVRENDFIAGDEDIDIGIAPGHVGSWGKIKKGFLNAGFTLYKEWIHKNLKTELSFTRNGTKIDLFFFRKSKKGSLFWHGVFGPAPGTGKYTKFLPNVFSSHLFSDLKEMMFKGHGVYLPNPPEKYLVERYGKDWRVPDKNYLYWLDCRAVDNAFFEQNKTVYISEAWDEFSVVHLNLIDEAKKIGDHITAGVITDKAFSKANVSPPLVSFENRFRTVKAIDGITEVVRQDGINPTRNFQKLNLKPDYVILTQGDIDSEFIKLIGGKVIHIPLEPVTPGAGRVPLVKPTGKVAIGIKTFMREEVLFKTIEAIKKNFPYPYRLYVADDSNFSDKKKYFYQNLEHEGHVIIQLPFDSGISRGRNAIVKKSTEKYILMMDDDILIQDPDTFKKMFAVLKDKKEIGLVAGVLKLERGGYFGNETYSRGLRLDVNEENKLLYRNPATKKYHKVNDSLYVFSEQVVNFFIAKREVFNDILWDNEIKATYEHMDFFLRMKKTDWKAAICLDAYAMHAHYIIDLEYERYRRPGPRKKFYSKHNIVGVVDRWK